MKRNASLWLWVAVIIVGGCATVEGLRQCAHVERIRAQQQQERADEIRRLAAEAQNAMMVVRELMPEDKSGLAELVDGIDKTQGMIVERAVAIEAGARRSEEWQTADSQTMGQPKKPLEPDTTQEDDARAGFQQRARTVARIRGAAKSLGAVITGRPLRGGALSGSSKTGWGAALLGGTLLMVGGGGAAAEVGRRLLKSVKATVQAVAQKDQERDDKDASRERRHEDLEQQMTRLTEMVSEVQASLANQPPERPASNASPA